MGYVLPGVAVQNVLQAGIQKIKKEPEIIDEIFSHYLDTGVDVYYGERYIQKIKNWFLEYKIPVVQAFSFNPQRVPCVSVKLASESEKIDWEPMSDFYGYGEEEEDLVNVYDVNIDIGIHVTKNSDSALWLYYIVSYILFRNKRVLESLGLQKQAFNVNDYNKAQQYMANNIWTRYIRFTAVVQNHIKGTPFIDINDIRAIFIAESTDEDNPPIKVYDSGPEKKPII